MKFHRLVFIAALGVALPGYAQDAAKPVAPPVASAVMNITDPQQFTDMAAVSNMFEIESSKLALEKATGQPVKDFAQHMIDDHTKAAEAMKQAVDTQGGVTLPNALDQKHQAMLDQLKAASGTDFDGQYLRIQLSAHQEAVGLFEGFSDSGQAGALKDFATKTLPTLQQHLQMVSAMSGGHQASPAASITPTTGSTAAVADPSILASGYVPTSLDNLSTEIIGKQVYSSAAGDAEHIGDVNNLVIGEGGSVAAVIIGVGGFLGLGEKNVAVKYSELQRATAEDGTQRFVLPTTKDALEAAPDFHTTDRTTPANDPAAANGALAPAAPAVK